MPSEIRDRVIEKLAELEHIQWQHWAKVRNPEHPLLSVPYSELTEEQKEQDRIWAYKILSIPNLAVVDREAGSSFEPTEAQVKLGTIDLVASELGLEVAFRRGYDQKHIDLLRAGFEEVIED